MSRYEQFLADEWERREEDEYVPDEFELADLAWKRAREDAAWQRVDDAVVEALAQSSGPVGSAQSEERTGVSLSNDPRGRPD